MSELCKFPSVTEKVKSRFFSIQDKSHYIHFVYNRFPFALPNFIKQAIDMDRNTDKAQSGHLYFTF